MCMIASAFFGKRGAYQDQRLLGSNLWQGHFKVRVRIGLGFISKLLNQSILSISLCGSENWGQLDS